MKIDFSTYYDVCKKARQKGLTAIRKFVQNQDNQEYFPKKKNVYVTINNLNDEVIDHIFIDEQDYLVFETPFAEYYEGRGLDTDTIVALCEEMFY